MSVVAYLWWLTCGGLPVVPCRYMEQSNVLMEQRNDSLKSSSEHNQARVLQAEQDKVRAVSNGMLLVVQLVAVQGAVPLQLTQHCVLA